MPSRTPTRNVVLAARPAQSSSKTVRSRPATTLPITDKKRKELLAEMQEPNDGQTPIDADADELEIEIEVIPDNE